MYILEHGEDGPPAAEAWEMSITEADKALTQRQTRSQTGETPKTGGAGYPTIVYSHVHSNTPPPPECWEHESVMCKVECRYSCTHSRI